MAHQRQLQGCRVKRCGRTLATSILLIRTPMLGKTQARDESACRILRSDAKAACRYRTLKNQLKKNLQT
jgi:hypothetical protein